MNYQVQELPWSLLVNNKIYDVIRIIIYIGTILLFILSIFDDYYFFVLFIVFVVLFHIEIILYLMIRPTNTSCIPRDVRQCPTMKIEFSEFMRKFNYERIADSYLIKHNDDIYKIETYIVRKSPEHALATNDTTVYREFSIDTLHPAKNRIKKTSKDLEEFKEIVQPLSQDGFVNVVDAYGITAYHEKKQ